MSMELMVKFKGEHFLLLGDLETGGPIATQEEYENGLCSYAHLFEDGTVRRLGKVIGSVQDVVVTGKCKIVPKEGAFEAMFVSPTWPQNT